MGDNDDDVGGDDDVNKFVEAGRTGSPVSKLCPDGESHNWAPVEGSAD